MTVLLTGVIPSANGSAFVLGDEWKDLQIFIVLDSQVEPS